MAPGANSTKETDHPDPAAGRRAGGHGLGSGMRCAGQGRSRAPWYLLGSREGMVEAGHVSHDGFLIWSGGPNDVCQEKIWS